ncbi:hypothetical protein [Intestinibacter bartlettii]|uniref:hypothetical protein n=1 Tax=Intestinibacter bartlettii TaxID=261299 RepID=UPI0034BCCD31
MAEENQLTEVQEVQETNEPKEQKQENLTMENIQKIIADSITANNKKFEELQIEKDKKIEELQNENKNLKKENILSQKMKFLVDNDLDPLLIPFLSDKKEEQEEQVKILKNVIEKEQKKALKTDMLNNQFKPSGGGSGDIKPQGRNLNKFKPLKKEIRGMY